MSEGQQGISLQDMRSANPPAAQPAAGAVQWIKALLLPSMAPDFQRRKQELEDQGNKIYEEMSDEQNRLRRVVRALTLERRSKLRTLVPDLTAPDQDPLELDLSPGGLRDDLRLFNEQVQWFHGLNDHLDYVGDRLKDIKERADCRACEERTGYRGLSDWAKETERAYRNLFNAISGISFVGAGLTYASIFSATRGNVGLMSYAFCLFIVALILSLTVQAMLTWYAQFPSDRPFLVLGGWEVVIAATVFAAGAAAVASVIILVVTVYDLQWGSKATEAATNSTLARITKGSMNPPGDAPLFYNVNPRPPAIVVFAVIWLGLSILLLILVLYSLAYNLKTLLWRRSDTAQKKKVGKRLAHYDV